MKKSFLFEKVAHVGSSFILSPALCFLFELRNPLFSKQWEPVLRWGILGIWFFGIACILILHNEFERRTAQMDGAELEPILIWGYSLYTLSGIGILLISAMIITHVLR